MNIKSAMGPSSCPEQRTRTLFSNFKARKNKKEHRVTLSKPKLTGILEITQVRYVLAAIVI
jgi:hypothetical protein